MKLTLKIWRKSKGWSQKELAEKLDISDVTISRWENPEKYPLTISSPQVRKLYMISNGVITPNILYGILA